MVAINPSTEHECLEFSSGGRAAHIFRPARLSFGHFPAFPWNSFFLVETQTLNPSGVYEENDLAEEQLLEISTGHYIDWSFFDMGNLGYDQDGEEIPLPENYRIISRYFQGKFLVVAKCSLWNRIPGMYDGSHSQMTFDQIHQQIQQMIDSI